MKPAFGVASILLGVGAAWPYIRSIYRGQTVPHRVSWLIWLLLAIVILLTQLQEGARWSLLLTIASITNDAIIFLLSIRRGTGGLTVQDKVAFLLACTGITIWFFTHTALYGLVFAIFADVIGVALTTRKAWTQPGSESGLAWTMSTLASCCAVAAIHLYTLGQTIFPIYAVCGGGVMALTALLRRPKFETAPALSDDVPLR